MPTGSLPFPIFDPYATARSVEREDPLDGIIASAPLPLPTSLQKTERPAWPAAPTPRGRDRRTFRFRRGWIALGAAIAVACTGTGGYLAYLNTLPTTSTLSVTNGQKEVPVDVHLGLNFNRPVSIDALKSKLSILPATQGTLVAESGQTAYAWVPAKPLADLTSYTLTLTAFEDTSKHAVKGGRWMFTTSIVPRIASVTLPDGTAVSNGLEIAPGSTMTFNFNDTMMPASVTLSLGPQPVALTWTKDSKSASMSTKGIPSGPLVLKLATGAKDSTGHTAKAWTLDTGLYYRDREHTTALKYPALIQVPNDVYARDQDGLQAASMVFEYLAEGGITRLTAVYDNAPDMIGPIRSSRLVSLKIGRHYKGLLFQSGESSVTQAAAGSDPTPQFFDTVGYTFRSYSRYAPDNLMITGDGVNRAEQKSYPNLAAFTVPKARSVLSGGTPATSTTVAEHYSSYSYDPIIGTYQKTEEGHPYSDAHTRQPLRIEMLVVLHTQVSLLPISDGHGSYIHDFNLDTTGHVDIFYKGMRYAATWTSSDGHGPLTFTGADGQPITLPPGLVWVDITA